MSNPLLERADFNVAAGSSGVMTLRGTINKSAILLILTIVGAAYTWSATRGGYSSAGMGYAMVGGIAGFILALVTCFKQDWSPITAPIYALCEGLFVGGISAMYEARTHGITVQAVMLTFGTFAGMLFLWALRELVIERKWFAKTPLPKLFAPKWTATAIAILTLLLGGLTTAWVIQAGHSGAKAAWKGKLIPVRDTRPESG